MKTYRCAWISKHTSMVITVMVEAENETHAESVSAAEIKDFIGFDVTQGFRPDIELDSYDQDYFGSCDDCGEVYELSDRQDHCGECGSCWDHCVNGGPHYSDELVTA